MADTSLIKRFTNLLPIIGRRGSENTISTFNISGSDLESDQDLLSYYDFVKSIPIISTSVRYYANLCSQANWQVIPHEEGAQEPGPEAIRYAEIVERMLFESETLRWEDAIRRLAIYKFYGFSVSELILAMHEDGYIGLYDLHPRAHTTLEFRRNELGMVIGAVQNVGGEQRFIPRERMVYLVDGALNDEPRGLGLLKSVEEEVDRLRKLLNWETISYRNNLRGIPKLWAPLQTIWDKLRRKIYKRGENGERDPELTQVRKLTQFGDNLARGKDQVLMLPSEPHVARTDSGDRISTRNQWDVDLIQGGPQGESEVGEAIKRTSREIARGLGTEFLYLGDQHGAYNLAENKYSHFSIMVYEGLKSIRSGIQNDVVARIFELNNILSGGRAWDKKYMPKIVVEKTNYRDTEEVITALNQLQNLNPEDPAIDPLRAQLGVEPRSERQMENIRQDREDNRLINRRGNE